MHILFIVPYAPTLIRVRPYNLIKSLVARRHRLTLVTLWADQAERQSLGQLEALGVRVVAQPQVHVSLRRVVDVVEALGAGRLVHGMRHQGHRRLQVYRDLVAQVLLELDLGELEGGGGVGATRDGSALLRKRVLDGDPQLALEVAIHREIRQDAGDLLRLLLGQALKAPDDRTRRAARDGSHRGAYADPNRDRHECEGAATHRRGAHGSAPDDGPADGPGAASDEG